MAVQWLPDACRDANLTFVLAHALYVKAIHGGKNTSDRIDSETLTHLLRSNLIPRAYVYPAPRRPLRALLRQRVCFVWNRAELLARIRSHHLAHSRTPAKQTRRNRDPWEEQLLQAEDHPLRQLAMKATTPVQDALRSPRSQGTPPGLGLRQPSGALAAGVD